MFGEKTSSIWRKWAFLDECNFMDISEVTSTVDLCVPLESMNFKQIHFFRSFVMHICHHIVPSHPIIRHPYLTGYIFWCRHAILLGYMSLLNFAIVTPFYGRPLHIWNKCVIPACVLFFFINDINWLQNLIKNKKTFHLTTLVTSSEYNLAAIVDILTSRLTCYMTCRPTIITICLHILDQ